MNALKTEEILLSEIIVNDNKESLDESNIGRLKLSIESIGLLCPLVIDQKYRLIAGRHRYEALRRIYQDYNSIKVKVVIFEDSSDEKCSTLTIDENIVRRVLSPVEHAEAIQYLVEDRIKKNGKVPGEPNITQAICDVASFYKVSVRDIRNDLKIAKIDNHLKKRIKGTPFERKKKQLIKLAYMDTLEKQVAFFEGTKVDRPDKDSLEYKLENMKKKIFQVRKTIENLLRKFDSHQTLTPDFKEKAKEFNKVSNKLVKEINSLSGLDEV